MADAKTAWDNASTLQRGLWIENRLRTLDADRNINHRPAGTPPWAVPGRSANDTQRPASWDKPLAQMAEQVSHAILQRGAAIALNPPPWATSYLGPVPADQTPLRGRWEHLAGQIETWRGLTDHQDPTKALPPPSRSRDASPQARRDLHVLHAAASDLRKDNGSGPGRVPQTGTPVQAQRSVPTPTGANGLTPRSTRTATLEATRTPATPVRIRPKRAQQAPTQRAKPLRTLIDRINAPALRQHLQIRAQIVDNIAIDNRNLEALRTLPRGQGEALIDRLQGSIRLQQDIATQQARLQSHDRQGPRRQRTVREIIDTARATAQGRNSQRNLDRRRAPQRTERGPSGRER